MMPLSQEMLFRWLYVLTIVYTCFPLGTYVFRQIRQDWEMSDLPNHTLNDPVLSLPPFHPFHVATHSYYAILASTLPSLLLLFVPWLLECKQRTKLHRKLPLL